MSLEIFTSINSPVSSNCHILYDTKSRCCIIVDPGTEFMSAQCDYIESQHLTPELIILTHEHFDHVWGCNFLDQKYRIPILCSSQCRKAIVNPKWNLSAFYQYPGFRVSNRFIEKDDYSTPYRWHEYEIRLFETLGHTDGSLCFIIGKYLFTGDTLLKEIKTVTKLRSGSPVKLTRSLDQIDACKGNQYIVYPGHGETFELDSYEVQKALK